MDHNPVTVFRKRRKILVDSACASDLIDRDLHRSLLPLHPKLSILYCLPKIHKTIGIPLGDQQFQEGTPCWAPLLYCLTRHFLLWIQSRIYGIPQIFCWKYRRLEYQQLDWCLLTMIRVSDVLGSLLTLQIILTIVRSFFWDYWTSFWHVIISCSTMTTMSSLEVWISPCPEMVAIHRWCTFSLDG